MSQAGLSPPPRTRVAVIVDLERNWLGGINYFRNLVSAIYDDPARGIDILLVVGARAKTDALKDFPPIEIARTSLLDAGAPAERLRKALIRILGHDLLMDRFLARMKVDVLSHSDTLGRKARTAVASWIPDLQHVHLPTHFSDEERMHRDRWVKKLCGASDVVILSSQSAQDDVLQLFPAAAPKTKVLRFVPQVEIGKELLTKKDLEARYGFSGPYLYLPNQFWAHKNHLVVVEALGLLARAGRHVLVISTGSPTDYRNPEHYLSLTARIDTLGIGDRFLRLGIVPYEDLLALVRHSACLINPSLFEGWSTTVEEARAMAKIILLSNIPVHREQSPAGCRFFEPHDAAMLAEMMWDEWTRASSGNSIVDAAPLQLAVSHSERRRAFSRRYHEIIAGVTRG